MNNTLLRNTWQIITLFKLMVYYTNFEYYNFFFPFKESVQFGPSITLNWLAWNGKGIQIDHQNRFTPPPTPPTTNFYTWRRGPRGPKFGMWPLLTLIRWFTKFLTLLFYGGGGGKYSPSPSLRVKTIYNPLKFKNFLWAKFFQNLTTFQPKHFFN